MFRPLAVLFADALRGGFRNPADSPRAKGKIVFRPVNRMGHHGGDTPSDRRAFHNRVKRRRAKKGYR